MLFKDFGDKNDGRGTLYQKYVGVPAFKYLYEPPLHIQKLSVESSKRNVFSKLMIDKAYNFDKFLVAPERKNVWHGVIRSQCEGVLSAKTYINPNDDRGVYTVIPEIEGAGNNLNDLVVNQKHIFDELAFKLNFSFRKHGRRSVQNVACLGMRNDATGILNNC